ncbi:MAG: HD-GYP domain-containing protein [Actinobacteria bacterium]|nr:HD-GYP domain-containing protein [Actinomycetota bacterium]
MRRRLPHTLDVAIILVASAIIPIYGFVLLGRIDVSLSPAWHVLLAGAAALMSAIGAGLLGVTAERLGDARSAAIGGALAIVAALLLVDAAGTPGFIAPIGSPAGLAGTLVLPSGAVLLIVASHPALRGPRHVTTAIITTIGGLALIAALLVRGLGQQGAVPAPDPSGPVGLAALGIGVAGYLLLATRASSTYLMTRRRRDPSVGIGLVWLGAAQVMRGGYPAGELGFWILDGLILAGLTAVAVPVALDLGSTSPSRPLGGDMRAAELVNQQEQFLGAQVRALMACLERKDLSTEAHTRRVAVLAVLIGERLGMGANDLRALATAGLLHDIGKLRVPDSVLGKTERLTDEEFKLIQQHPVWGDELLTELEGFAGPLRTAVRQHHERLDGSGYPEGVGADNITTYARIVSVADVYDALTTDRPYREAWPSERALAEIHRCAGREYCPIALAALEDVVAAGRAPEAVAPAPLWDDRALADAVVSLPFNAQTAASHHERD